MKLKPIPKCATMKEVAESGIGRVVVADSTVRAEMAALVKLALELAYECRMRCYDHATHDAQIKELRALESRWECAGRITPR